MKKYLVLFFLLASLTSFGQFSNYTNINGRYKWIAGKFDSTFTLPSGTTPSLRVGGGTGPGALFYSTTDSTVYQYTGTRWTRLRGTDTAHVVSAYVRNTTASTMTAGQVVYINGSTGTTPTIALAVNTADSTSAMTFGFVRGTIAPNAFGWITSFGPLDGVNTNAYTEGEVIYLDSIPGQFTHDKPQAPYHMVTLGYIVKKSGGNGTIFAKIQNGYELDELHNVRITEPVLNKSVIIYDSVRRLWVDTTVSAAGLGLGGSGTTNYLSKWTSSSALGNSLVFDNGTSVGIGTTSPAAPLHIKSANVAFRGQLSLESSDIQQITFYNGPTTITNLRAQIYSDNNGLFILSQAPLFFGGNGVERARIASTGNFLINTTTDAGYRLDVSGTFRSTLDANINGLTVGKGNGSLAENTAVGLNALSSTTGSYNVAIGWNAMASSNTSSGSVAVGIDALRRNTTGENTSVGGGALAFVTTGSLNTAVGRSALAANTGSNNTAIGHQSLLANTSGSDNVSIGTYASIVSTTATGGISIGFASMLNLTTGNYNIGIGNRAGQGITTGTYNTILGSFTAGSGITTGSYNTIIGSQITGLSSSLSNTIILADGQGNQRLYINNSGNVGIGTTSPSQRLDVAGGIQAGAFSLGTTATNKTSRILASNFTATNNVTYSFVGYRTANGSDWFTAALGINLNVDATDQGVIAYVTRTGNIFANDGFSTTSGSVSAGNDAFGGVFKNINAGGTAGGTSTSAGAFSMTGTSSANISNYGVYITNTSTVSGTGRKWALFSNAGNNYFADNVLIGTTTDAGYKLDVNGTARATKGYFGSSSNYGATDNGIQITNNGGFYTNNTGNGQATLYNYRDIRIMQRDDLTTVISRIGIFSTDKANFEAVNMGNREAFSVAVSGTYDGTEMYINNIGLVRFRRLTTDPSNPAYLLSGGVFYNSTDNNLKIYNGTNWQPILTPNSSGNVGIGTTSPNASALLDVSSTTKGFLPPRMTGANAEAIGTPAAGLLVYINNGNGTTITSTGWWGYDGTTWVKLN